MDKNLRDALVNAVMDHVTLAVPGASITQAFHDVIAELTTNPKLAAAWEKAFAEHDPGALPLDFPGRTPAEIIARQLGRELTTYAPRGLTLLTGPQINALAEAANLTGNWGAPTHATWNALIRYGLVNGASMITPLGRAWLRAAGLLKDGQ